jgi:hypothetical protein
MFVADHGGHAGGDELCQCGILPEVAPSNKGSEPSAGRVPGGRCRGQSAITPVKGRNLGRDRR